MCVTHCFVERKQIKKRIVTRLPHSHLKNRIENRSEMVNRSQQSLFLIGSPDETDKIKRAETSQQGLLLLLLLLS